MRRARVRVFGGAVAEVRSQPELIENYLGVVARKPG